MISRPPWSIRLIPTSVFQEGRMGRFSICLGHPSPSRFIKIPKPRAESIFGFSDYPGDGFPSSSSTARAILRSSSFHLEFSLDIISYVFSNSSLRRFISFYSMHCRKLVSTSRHLVMSLSVRALTVIRWIAKTIPRISEMPLPRHGIRGRVDGCTKKRGVATR